MMIALRLNGTCVSASSEELYNSESCNKEIFRSFDFKRPISHIAVGYSHALFVSVDGKLFATGEGSCGELGVGVRISYSEKALPVPLPKGFSVKSIAAGPHYSAVIASPSNCLFTFGSGAYCRLGHGFDTDCLLPTMVTTLEHVGMLLPTGRSSGLKLVACGWWHMVCVAADTNDVFTWGWNKFGQNGSTSMERGGEKSSPRGVLKGGERSDLIRYPRRVTELDDDQLVGVDGEVIAVSCGSRHSALLVDRGSAGCKVVVM